MDLSTGVLLGVVAVMGANQVLMRVASLRGVSALFWLLQAVNLAVACGVLLYGMPGFEHVPAIKWMIGLLFLWRTIQNNGLHAQYQREQRAAQREEARDAAARQWEEALEKGEQDE